MTKENSPPPCQRAVGVFTQPLEIEQALQDLKGQGFPMEQVTVIAQDKALAENVDSSVEVQSQISSGIDKGATAGGALGAISGLLVGLVTTTVPGLGPVMLAGAAATTLLTATAAGIAGATTGGLAGALAGFGVPEKYATVYNDYVAKGYYVLLLEGTVQGIKRAHNILSRSGIQDWQVFFAIAASTPVES